METIRLTEENMPQAVARAVEVLRKGGVVLYPTDTLYGLAVDAANTAALAQLRTFKGRETKKPISIVVPSVDAIQDYVEWNDTARALADAHLPGPLTLVLPALPHVPLELQLIGQLGVRVPHDSFSQHLATVFGRAFTATSANKSGLPTHATTDEILLQFGPHIIHLDLVIDAGERAGGVGSTVVTFRDGVPYIIRNGKLSSEDLGISR